MLRQPIITVLGHVDHGKTSMLDAIRQTAVAAKEAGGITQAIGTTEIPAETLEKISGEVMRRFNFSITVPGLLFIDTPGHEAFTTLRKRGGSIADIAILVVDVVKGVQPQTIESIQILRESKTPFVIAMNKIDMIDGWKSASKFFIENFDEQTLETQGYFEEKFYHVAEQFNEYNFRVERFDRVTNFATTIAAVPISARSGEGIPELLAILTGLAQQFLKNRLETSTKTEGMILEVKEVTGLGKTIDVIIYNGVIEQNQYLIIGGIAPTITKIKALLVPESLRDMRTEKKFHPVSSCVAACGIKISAADVGDVVAGSPLRVAATKEEAETILEELKKEKETTEINAEREGLILKADTIGGLEAMIHIFSSYPIKRASIGQISKTDIILTEANINPIYKIVIGFNVNPSEEAQQMAKGKGSQILVSDVIYRLIEGYEKWQTDEIEARKRKELEGVQRPGKIRFLAGCIFRASNPAVIGCEVIGGSIKAGYTLFKLAQEELKDVGEIKQIQSQGETVEEAKSGDKVAISINGPVVGRQIFEQDVFYVDLKSNEYKMLVKHQQFLTATEKTVLEEIFSIKKSFDPLYGF
ncbi:MAG: translation initiation factor IF-2 [Candidatus Aenigmarchaeota archaeon]|nr:translation initiation factor IF-2 [Candidatus Aenigmarchaeota archaeon]